MSGELKAILGLAGMGTVAVCVALSCGKDGYIVGGFLGFLGGACGYVIRTMREKRKAQKKE